MDLLFTAITTECGKTTRNIPIYHHPIKPDLVSVKQNFRSSQITSAILKTISFYLFWQLCGVADCRDFLLSFSWTIHSLVLFHGCRFLWQQKRRKRRLGLDRTLSSTQHRGGWDPHKVGEYPEGEEDENREGGFSRNKTALLNDSSLFSVCELDWS